jgi:hypothetical protein
LEIRTRSLKLASFLASDEASYIAGIELYVDGGVAQIRGGEPTMSLKVDLDAFRSEFMANGLTRDS